MDSDRAQMVELLNVSRETLEALDTYAALLARWNRTINLVSNDSIDVLWTRHFLDSAQLVKLVDPRGHWADLGSGGGLPALVAAILLREHRDLRFSLVESDQRKAAFLRTVARELGLPAQVIAKRIEDVAPLSADILTARALAPLTILLDHTARHLGATGVAVFPKGEKADGEIAVALERWRFDCKKHQSITDLKSSILCIGELSRV